MAALVVYSRRGCHLCEILIEELLPMVRGRLEPEIRDIGTCEAWHRDYHARIPVVEYDGEAICQYHLDRDAILRLLDDSLT
jgi:hypothetical protein